MKLKRITPELVSEDIKGTIEFYTKILGFKLDSSYPAENPVWIRIKKGHNLIMFESRKSLAKIIPEINKMEIGGSFNLYFEIEDIDVFYENMKNKAEIIAHLTTSPFKQFAIKDVNGYILLFGQHN